MPMDLSYERVLVPLDGSQFARAAMWSARALAERLGAELHTVSVAGSDDEVDELRHHAADALGVAPDDPRVHVRTDDDVASAIARCADDLHPCVICMSTHGRGRLAGAIMGSVARSLLADARAPLVVVGRLQSGSVAPLSVPRLVACVDGSAPSERLAETAGRWADALDMSLTLLTVAEPMPAPVRTGAKWHRRHGPDEDADDYVRRLQARHATVARQVDAAVHYDPISPAEGVRDFLQERPAGLLAVTTHARSGLGRLALGADAAAIVSQSTVPVLVVPLSAEARSRPDRRSGAVYRNDEVPPGVELKADPTAAAIGIVDPGRSVEDVHADLTHGGVPADRIHFLSGDDGIAFLDDLGNWFSRLASQSWHDARDELASGHILVGVFDVDDADAERIRALLTDAGVSRIRSFGTWTWAE